MSSTAHLAGDRTRLLCKMLHMSADRSYWSSNSLWARLFKKAVGQAQGMLNVPAPSQASQLPQNIHRPQI
jgi:hypothetical protein